MGRHVEWRLMVIDVAVKHGPRLYVIAEHAAELDDPWQVRSVAPPTIPREQQDPSSSRVYGFRPYQAGLPGPQDARLVVNGARQDQLSGSGATNRDVASRAERFGCGSPSATAWLRCHRPGLPPVKRPHSAHAINTACHRGGCGRVG
jgi:hypothetical protein